AALGLSSGHDDFKVLKSDLGIDGINHVRLQHVHEGIRVWGSDVVVHSNAKSFTGLAGNVVKIKALDLNPSVAATTAVAIAKAQYAHAALNTSPLSYSRETQELVVLPMSDGSARLAWFVVFYTERQAGINPGLWHYFVDAHDSTIVNRWNGI